MSPKVIFLILAVLFVNVASLSLRNHDAFNDKCFYYPVGSITKNPQFNYTVDPAYTATQESQVKAGTLNASQFIRVKGWVPYRTPNQFFSTIAAKGPQILKNDLTFIQDVKGEPYSKTKYGLSTSDLQFAFGNPSQAKEYKVPSGKAIITLRFQAAVTSNPFVGSWSVLVQSVNNSDIQARMKAVVRQVQDLAASTKLSPKEVTSVANIIPPFVENSVFWTLNGSPPKGTVRPVEYEGFVNVIRGGELVLAGPIYNGQPGVIQVKDLVASRTNCT